MMTTTAYAVSAPVQAPSRPVAGLYLRHEEGIRLWISTSMCHL